MSRGPIAGVLAAKEDLENLTKQLRGLGVRRLRVGELELELGDLPSPQTLDDPAEAKESERRRRIAQERERLDIEWAHVGGVSHLPDDDIERSIRGENLFGGRQ